MEPAPPRSISVEILSAVPAPPTEMPAPAALSVNKAAAEEVPFTEASQKSAPVALPKPTLPSPFAGMNHPTHLFARNYIREPASLEIRQNLPRLAPEERATQICNIEAGQQIQAANPKVFVDTVHASALGDTSINNLTVTAPQAAYRSRRQWYSVSFVCAVAPDFSGVVDFRFKMGAPIPRALWDAHALNAEDDNE